jgi:hypothetical protein
MGILAQFYRDPPSRGMPNFPQFASDKHFAI